MTSISHKILVPVIALRSTPDTYTLCVCRWKKIANRLRPEERVAKGACPVQRIPSGVLQKGTPPPPLFWRVCHPFIAGLVKIFNSLVDMPPTLLTGSPHISTHAVIEMSRGNHAAFPEKRKGHRV